MFQTKVPRFEERHKRVSLVWPWVTSPKSGQSHFEFYKWKSHFSYSCSFFKELFETSNKIVSH